MKTVIRIKRLDSRYTLKSVLVEDKGVKTITIKTQRRD